MHEFDIIKNYFAKQHLRRKEVVVGIGDDAAVVSPQNHSRLIVTSDTLVSGVHFPHHTSAFDVGFKSLAVNLSDLAAMGATPAWVMLALTIPKANVTWINSFCRGFFQLAKMHHVQLIGGDLSHGPLSITVQAMGLIQKNKKPLLRSAAKPGDFIFVSNTLGDAGVALHALKNKIKLSQKDKRRVLLKLNRPHPQINLGSQLLSVAHAAIDISDGLIADLKHILIASNVGAIIDANHLPLSPILEKHVSHDQAIKYALTAGDDYELCFTVPKRNINKLRKIIQKNNYYCTCIGIITKKTHYILHYKNKKINQDALHGYEHF